MATKTATPLVDGHRDPGEYIAHYPGWAKQLAHRYFTKTVSQFILHGNVRDLVRTQDDEGQSRYISLRDFLTEDLFASRDLIILYDRSAGIHFVDAASKRDFSRALTGYDSLFGTDFSQRVPKDPVRVFSVLENYFRLRLADGKRIAFILDYAETIAPMADTSMYGSEDRNALVFLQKWAHDPLFLRSDFTTCLVTENLSDLNRQLVQNPYIEKVAIEIPAAAQRRDFIEKYVEGSDFGSLSEVSAEALAHNTAGLNFIQLRTLLADVLENRNRLTFARLSDRKKELIEAEAYGLLEFVEPDFDLSHVAGHGRAKEHLKQAAEAIRRGRRDVMPMGYLVTGPVGTGKTFIITCFAGEIGIPMVKLRNFRSQWQGVTEGNLEKILTLLDAMSPVAVMIDEADAALGDRNAQGDSGVSSRVFAQIANFMSNPRNRGRVIWFLLTARPDLMPIDLKRQGRAEEHIALFYPSTREEREELVKVMLRRTNISVPISRIPEALLNGERSFSGADMEALLTRAKFRAAASGKRGGKVTPATLQEVFDDFIPPTYPLEIELQTLAAVAECTSMAMLPDSYRDLDREVMSRRLEELKRLTQER